MKTFTITLGAVQTAAQRITTTFEIEAESEEEARRLAYEETCMDWHIVAEFDWEIDENSIEIDNINEEVQS